MANISQINGLLINAATASLAVTASFALAVAGGGSTFPYVGNAVITGSLIVSGSGLGVTGSTSIRGTFNQGTNNTTTGIFSYTQGDGVLATNSGSHAEGQYTAASGMYSHAEGQYTVATGNYSHAEGNGDSIGSNLAQGAGSHAEGYLTQAAGQYSHAEGSGISITDGEGSYVEYVQANAAASHAEGYLTRANAFASHTEGASTQTNGSYAHAEGFSTNANGFASHTEGFETQAQASGSHAEGLGTMASGSYQHVQGQYNILSSAQSAFIIGNGTDGATRSNLVFASGSQFQITGSLNVSGSITGSLFGSASYATTASLLTGRLSTYRSFGTGSMVGTGSTSLTATTSFLIPANTFTTGDILRVRYRVRKLATNANTTTGIYINTTNNISTATTLGILTGNTTSMQMKRDFYILAATGINTEHVGVGTSLATDDTATGRAASTINWAVDQYMIFGITHTNTNDSGYSTMYYLERV
jgi:hypothetical protein